MQRELFVKVVTSHSIRMFLEWFTLTQMFDVFITDRLKDDFVPGRIECFVIVDCRCTWMLVAQFMLPENIGCVHV